VIVSCGKATEALEWTRGVVGWLGLTLNEKKTSIRNARKERFDFLGKWLNPPDLGSGDLPVRVRGARPFCRTARLDL
jgi:RNA-directed DNA polymerase